MSCNLTRYFINVKIARRSRIMNLSIQFMKLCDKSIRKIVFKFIQLIVNNLETPILNTIFIFMIIKMTMHYTR